MGKQSKSRKTEKFGKGKVTPVQVAFIVDRYLSDNNYTQTRSTFRSEVSDLISKSPVQEAPKSLLSLGAMLDEYICLKEQKVLMDQEKYRLEQEKFRVQTLLRGMQDAMNAYNGSGNTSLPKTISSKAPKSAALTPQLDSTIGSSLGYPAYNTPVMTSESRPPNGYKDPANFSTPIITNPTSKRRRNSKVVLDAPITTKKSRTRSINNQVPIKGNDKLLQSSNAVHNQEKARKAFELSPHDKEPNESPAQGSKIAKCLFNKQIQSPPNNSSGPTTPPRETTSSQTEKSISPLEVSSIANSVENVTPQQFFTFVSSEAIKVSPVKQIAYYSIERNHRISMSPVKTNLKRLGKRDHIKGRLDFDASDKQMTSEASLACGTSSSQSDKEIDDFDLDLPSLDALGVDFSLSDLLVDFDLYGEGINYSCQPSSDSPNSYSGSPNGSHDTNLGTNQVFSEFSSTVTEIHSEKEMNAHRPDSMTSVKSITKCIKIISPLKNRTSAASDQENTAARN